MAKKLFVLVVLAVFVAGVSYSCKKKQEEAAEEIAAALEEMAEGEEGEAASTEEGEEGEEEAEEGEGGGGGACDAYAKCCNAYVDALAKVDNVPESAITAAKEGCKQIENLKKLPTANDACQQALDAMKKGAEAYKSMPGFEWPEECK